MGSYKNGVFHCNSIMNCTSFEPMFKSPNGMDPLYASSNWDPIVSLNQSGNFRNSSNMAAQNEFDHFSDMVSSFGHIPQLNHAINPENGMLGHSPPYGKRERKILIEGSPKDAKEEDEKKQNFEGNVGPIYRNKLEVKQSNDDSSGAEPSKENYIHMRAKRGQATNSRSLAERVRRERIGERMRLLQELVPGCNKITGKAVMLDEIINYVQSLQQQVEFLSMKLATHVNPEMNVDIDHVLFKDGYPQGTFNVPPGINPPFHSLPQPTAYTEQRASKYSPNGI